MVVVVVAAARPAKVLREFRPGCFWTFDLQGKSNQETCLSMCWFYHYHVYIVSSYWGNSKSWIGLEVLGSKPYSK